jgi:FKBP-type peptidyl-prolyl cis-trans isomerase
MRTAITLLAALSLLTFNACSKADASGNNTSGSAAVDSADLAPPADVAAAPKDAKRTASGLAYKSLKKGTGMVHPRPTNSVTVHYTGWTTDGKMFDSSVKRGKPATFPLNRVIKGWTEGLQLMVQGEKMRFWIPGNLAYGDTPRRPGAPAGTLVFDVELLSFK